VIAAFLPRTIDNTYRGHKAALWILGLLVLLKLVMSWNSIVNGRSVATRADGLPLDTYSADAAQTIVAMFGMWAVAHLMICLLCILALVRYRAFVPFLFAWLLVEQLGRKLLLQFIPIIRVGAPPSTAVNLALIALMVAGLALSLWERRVRPDATA
jgi:hypothetical protein